MVASGASVRQRRRKKWRLLRLLQHQGLSILSPYDLGVGRDPSSIR